MAWINLSLTEKVEIIDGEDVKLDVVHYKYTRVLQDLLPPGRAFTRRTGSFLQKFLAGLGMEFSRLQRRISRMLREADPRTSVETIALWETLLGLPDCEEPTDLASRRIVAAKKLGAAAGHTQELGWWEALFESLDYVLVEAKELGDYVMDCDDDCIDGLFSEEYKFVVWLITNHGGYDDILECQVDAEKLLGMLPLVHWSWELQDNPVDPPATFRGVATSQNGWTVAVGSSGSIIRAKEFLSNWTEITPPALLELYAVAGAGGALMIAVGEPGQALVSGDGGENWTLYAPATPWLYGVSRVDTLVAEAVAVGGGGEIWKITDAGATWTSKISPVATELRAVARAAGAMIAVGLGGVIIQSVDAGESWSSITSPTGEHLRGVSGWGDDVVAVGDNGTIIVSDDAGATWTAATSGTTATLSAVDIAPGGRWTVAGYGGVLLQSVDKGATWTLASTPTSDDLMAVSAGALLGLAVVVGDNNTIIIE